MGEPERHLLEVDPEWPELRIEQVRADLAGTAGHVELHEERAEVWITDRDRVELDRADGTLRFSTARELADDVIVHPYLALPASIASHWLGRQVLHGGAFLHAGRGWALLGAKEAGKSSTLGWLLERGHEVLTDDVLVIDGGQVLSGPRCIDLRGDAGARFGGEDLGVLGSRGRWRLRPAEVPPSVPLGGIVHLGWATEPALEPVPLAERVGLLVEHSVVRPESAEAGPYLNLATLPTWRFTRPRGLDRIDEANAQLLAGLG